MQTLGLVHFEAVVLGLPGVDRVLGTPYSRATSSAVRPASTRFSAAMICASVCLLLLMPSPQSEIIPPYVRIQGRRSRKGVCICSLADPQLTLLEIADKSQSQLCPRFRYIGLQSKCNETAVKSQRIVETYGATIRDLGAAQYPRILPCVEQGIRMSQFRKAA